MKILIIACTDIATDPRVIRQIQALEGHQITTCGSSNANYDFYKTPPRNLYRKLKRFFWLLTGQFEKFYWDDYKKELSKNLSGTSKDVVIANDIYSLPLALAVGGKVCFDAHEYYPKEWNTLKWNLLYKKYQNYVCRKYIPKATSFMTSSASIAKAYKDYINITPVVVTNAAKYHHLQPGTMNGSAIKLIHHGAAIQGRKIEKMIHMMRYLDKHVLYLMLTGNNSYLNYLKRLASEKVKFLDPVYPAEVCTVLNKFDVGVYCMYPSNYNNEIALPNKIFDFVQGRLALVVSPTIEMANIVRRYNLGEVSQDFTSQSMAEAVKKLGNKEDIMRYKNNSHFAADELCAEKNYEIIRKLAS